MKWRQVLLTSSVCALSIGCTQKWEKEQIGAYMNQCQQGFTQGYVEGVGSIPNKNVVEEWCNCHLKKTMKEYTYDEVLYEVITDDVKQNLDKYRDDCYHDLNVQARLESDTPEPLMGGTK